MKNQRLGLVLFLMTGFFLSSFAQNWPSWRGPLETGEAPGGNPPIEFNLSKNLKWKVNLPGIGHSTPIVWGDKIFVSSAAAIGDEKNAAGGEAERRGRGMAGTSTDLMHKFIVSCVNKLDGSVIWQTTVREEVPIEKTHRLGSWASNSSVTDGKFLYAYFGSRGLFCLDMDGKVLWDRDFGQMEKIMSFGEGSSPALYKNKLIILWDHEGESMIVAIDTKTGKDVWKVIRDEKTSWATPLVVEVNGKPQVITSATGKARSYDLESGDLVWECTGLTRNVIPNPIYADGILYLMSGYRGNALMAIDLAKAKGDISESETILWQYNQDTPYTPSPLLMDGKLYFLRANNGEITCLNAKDGSVVYAKTKVVGIGNTYSSPTGVGDRIYIAGDGNITVISTGSPFEVLATNQIEDTFRASPVILGSTLLLRGIEALYCFE